MNELGFGRWDWLLFSVVLGTLASLLRWLISFSAARSRTQVLLLLQQVVDSPWVTQPLRLAYAVGIPAALLFWERALTTRGLGLKPFPDLAAGMDAPALSGGQWTEWAHDLGWAALVASVTFLLVWIGDRAARQGAPPAQRSHRDLWISLREAVYYQAHWAFYREPFVVLWGLSTGSWLGALPVALEAVLSPMLWEGMRGDTDYARRVVLRCGLYAATTLVFLQTQNLWVAVAVDILLGWLLVPHPLVDVVPAPARTGGPALERS